MDGCDEAKQEECLVCGMERSNSENGEQCKLCGMRSENPAYYMVFPFCCGKCVEQFKRIMSKTPVSEREWIMEKDIVI